MNRTLLPVLVLLVGMCSGANAEQWKEYQPSGEGYRIDFPGTPTEDTRRVQTRAGTVELHTSAMGLDNRAFITIRSDYPSTVDLRDSQAALDRARNGSLTKAKGTLRSEQRLMIGDAHARHLVIDLPESNQLADAIMVVQDHHLLQAVYIGPNRPGETPEARRFLSSFALVK
jgi:hypothetical protein